MAKMKRRFDFPKENQEMASLRKMQEIDRLGRRRSMLDSFPKGGKVVEVGVLFGQFSEEMLTILEPSDLYLVDPWAKFAAGRTTTPEGAYQHVKAKFADYANVHVIRQDSVVAAADFEDNSLDVVYIDGNHSYPSCSADLKAWYPKVRPGGILAGDDFRPRDFKDDPTNKVVKEDFGTVRAVKEFIGTNRFTEFRIVVDQFWLVKC